MVEADRKGRKPLISGNWKMHLNHFEATALVQKLAYELTPEDFAAVDVSIHPSFTNLRTVQTYFLAEKDPVPMAIGAQNCHWEEKGPYTGEVSPAALRKLDVAYVIAGHSERRELFGETDDMVNRKVRAIFQWDMTPILCVGETLDERDAGVTEAKVTGQVEAGLSGLSAEQVAALVIAYEPIWAIGTGRTATPDDAQAVCATIRATVAASAASPLRRGCASSTGGRSSLRTPPTSWPAPTSTVPWWAAPASRATRSRPSSATAIGPDFAQDGVTTATECYTAGATELRQQRSGRGAGCVTMPRQADANGHLDAVQAVIWVTESAPGQAILLSSVRSPGCGLVTSGGIQPRGESP